MENETLECIGLAIFFSIIFFLMINPKWFSDWSHNRKPRTETEIPFKKSGFISDIVGKDELRDWDRSGTDTFTKNKVIAEFMGGIVSTSFFKQDYSKENISNPEISQLNSWKFPKEFYAMDGGRYDAIQGLRFHSDWNWLMEVVNKIESVNLTYRITYPYNVADEFERVVKMIEWYNQNKNK